MDKKQKQIIKISVFITSIFVILLSVTYAFINVQLTGTKKQVITAGTLDLILDEDDNNLTITDALPMYDEVGMIQEPFTFRLINNTEIETNYVLKLTNITVGEQLDKTIVKYGLTKNGVGEPSLLSTLPDDGAIDSGTIGNKETIEYTLRLWIDSSVTDNSVISGKSLSYRIDLEASQEIEKDPSSVEAKLFASENLGENCTTYDDGVDTFLVGQCSNNYVWYSGKLWRVVLKNNKTGAVKMVTDNAITTISYDVAGNTGFENSYMDQWLNQEFLPTLHDTESYLVTDYVWDATLDNSSTPSRPSYDTSVTRTVGLLNAYEYYTTYNNSDSLATYSNGYLNNDIYWWLMTPYSVSKEWYVINYGSLSDITYYEYEFGVRPSVNLKSTIQISGGTGVQSEPYILEGDMQEPANGTTLLNTKYSGEYITFNNELYRIVDIENGLTKITAVDVPSRLLSNVFDSDYFTSFAEADIKTDLENYYQEMKTTNENAYNMIEPSTTWYLGQVGNYKEGICATVDVNTSMSNCTEKTTSTTANIGLPRVGEMFTSQITRGIKDNFWTLTPLGSTTVWIVYNYGALTVAETPNSHGARPSMYLKSNVVIASDNTGNGTYEYPYSLELGE